MKELDARIERDLREERIRHSTTYRKVQRGLWRKWRQLARDKEFLLETARLKLNLTLAWKEHPQEVAWLLRTVLLPVAPTSRVIPGSARGVRDKHLKVVFQRYSRYVCRFGVVMRIAKTPPYFRSEAIWQTARKFHVQVMRGHLRPITISPDEEELESNFFASDAVGVAPEMERAIRDGNFKYVQVDDDSKGSLLQELVDFAYSPNDLTFVLLASKQPYVLCIIGDNVSIDGTWHRAGRVVAEFQEHQYGRIRAGRPVDFQKLRRDLAVLLRKEGTMMEKAILLSPESARSVYSKLSALSQLKRKLKL